MFWSVLNCKLSFIVDDNNVSDGDDDDGNSSEDDGGDDNLPNWPLYNNQRDTHTCLIPHSSLYLHYS